MSSTLPNGLIMDGQETKTQSTAGVATEGQAAAGKPKTRSDQAEERLAAALRENLKRRKAQARGRQDDPTPEEETKSAS